MNSHRTCIKQKNVVSYNICAYMMASDKEDF